MENPNNILDLDMAVGPRVRRRKMLPWWIKVFVWIFMITGAIAPLGIISGLFGYGFVVALYGVSTNDPLSPTGLLLIVVYLFKGFTAYGLWFEKDWAITVAKTDAAIGILICAFVMLILPSLEGSQGTMSFRLELLFILAFLVKIAKIGPAWKGAAG